MLDHILIALATVLLAAGVSRNWTAGATAASAWAISREITQAEYRWIERFGDGLRANMPWWGGFDLRVWHADAWLDWIVPCLAAIAFSLLLGRWRFSPWPTARRQSPSFPDDAGRGDGE